MNEVRLSRTVRSEQDECIGNDDAVGQSGTRGSIAVDPVRREERCAGCVHPADHLVAALRERIALFGEEQNDTLASSNDAILIQGV